MDYCQVDKTYLLSLLKDAIALSALENGGVDNWEFYGEAINEFLGEYEDIDELADEIYAELVNNETIVED